MSAYDEFLRAKAALSQPSGFQVAADDVHPTLKPHQADIVRWPDCPAEHDQPTPPPAPQPARPTLPRQVRAWAHQLLRRTK